MEQNTTSATITDYLMSSPSGNFFLLAGPCVIEGETMAMEIAERVASLTSALGIPYVFKGSYRKANRSRIDSFTGIGDQKALEILRKVVPRSVMATFLLPASRTLFTACRMASGERNWPFFMFTIFPVSAAATRRSVWRQRNAGICSMSTYSAAMAAS